MQHVNARARALCSLAMGVVLAVSGLGCQEDIVLPDARLYPFSMWGLLNPQADTQSVRVFPVERSLTTGAPGPLAARFVSTNLTTNEEVVWRDSVFVDSMGVVGHVFYAPFRAEYETTYRLAITRDDGARSWVEVETPGEVVATVEPATTTPEGRIVVPVSLRGEQPRLLRSTFEVFFVYVTDFLGTPPFLTPVCHYVHLNIDYEDRLRRTDDGWQTRLDFTEAFLQSRRWALEEADAVEADPALYLFGNALHAVIANEAWNPPGGVFDPNVLVQPGAMENVQNGFGFVGGGYQLSRTWSLDQAFVEQTGFTTGTSCERGKESTVFVTLP